MAVFCTAKADLSLKTRTVWPTKPNNLTSLLTPGLKYASELSQYPCLENSMDGGAWWATSPWGRKESDTTERLHSLTHTELSHPRGKETGISLIS